MHVLYLICNLSSHLALFSDMPSQKNISFSNTLTKAKKTKQHNGQVLPELHLAAEKGNLELVKAIAKKKKRLLERNYFGGTALTMAVLHSHVKVVEHLLLRGSDPNAQTTKGYAPLHVAAKAGDRHVVDLLILKGAKVNLSTFEGYTPLFIATFCGKRDIARTLLAAKADVGSAAGDGTTCLHSATEMGYDDLVSLLIRSGADVNDVMCDGETPLHIASRRGHARIVTQLLDAGADMNLTTAHGVAPLHLCCRYGHKDLVKRFLAAGAIPDSKMTLVTGGSREDPNNDGFDSASVSGASVMSSVSSPGASSRMSRVSRGGSVKSVASSRGSINRDTGWTGLHFAAYGGYTEMVKDLLAVKADVNTTTSKGEGRLTQNQIVISLGEIK